MTILAEFVKKRRKKLRLTQQGLAEKAGVGLRFIRELEQGKTFVSPLFLNFYTQFRLFLF